MIEIKPQIAVFRMEGLCKSYCPFPEPKQGFFPEVMHTKGVPALPRLSWAWGRKENWMHMVQQDLDQAV